MLQNAAQSLAAVTLQRLLFLHNGAPQLALRYSHLMVDRYRTKDQRRPNQCPLWALSGHRDRSGAIARCSIASVADLHVPQYAATITVDDPLPPDVAIAPVTIRTIAIGIGAIIIGIRITIVAITVVRRGGRSNPPTTAPAGNP